MEAAYLHAARPWRGWTKQTWDDYMLDIGRGRQSVLVDFVVSDHTVTQEMLFNIEDIEFGSKLQEAIDQASLDVDPSQARVGQISPRKVTIFVLVVTGIVSAVLWLIFG